MSTAAAGQDTPLPVLVVDDSAVLRRFVRAALGEGVGLQVVAEARSGREAVALVGRLHPAVILMDLTLPGMSGLEAIERIMAAQPTPILVYASSSSADADAAAALAAGAVDVLAKPGTETSLQGHADELRRRLRLAARIRVITHPRGRLAGARPGLRERALRSGQTLPAPQTAPALQTAPAPQTAPAAQIPQAPRTPPPPRAAARPRAPHADQPVARPLGSVAPVVIAIGASTGGPPALAAVLSALPAQTPAAFLVIQHMADGFVEGLAGWLDELCPLPVSVAASGQRLRPGTVTLAPTGLNLLVDSRLRVSLRPPPDNQFHVPGIDVTFAALAAACGPDAVGVLLTGMGRDGAAGLKQLHERGAFTIAQDESTSAVYGMPGAAVALGAAELVLPLPEIGPALRALALPEDGPPGAQAVDPA